jgi:hypothetical protein
VKHSNVFTDDTIAEFYRKYPLKPLIIAHAAFDSVRIGEAKEFNFDF